MIQFPCHCGHQFELSDDSAGGIIQCPQCGRLNDVPTHEDLAHIEQDGTYKIDQTPEQDEAERLEELRHVFGQRIDGEIDLRPTLDDVERAGAEEEPFDPARNRSPKYDPVTGELVRPLDFQPEPPPPPPPKVEPVRPALDYARGDTPRHVGPLRIPLELLMPGNAVVIFFIFLFHLFAEFVIAIVAAFGMFFVAPVVVLILMLVVAHYGNIIDDVATEDRDEIPRPLRGLEWSDDIWRPFSHFFGGLVICYLPAMLVLLLLEDPLAMPLAGAMAAAGTLFLPAVLLTTVTSGTAHNLRPDRVLGVVWACGIGYFVPLVLWVLALVVYGAGLLYVLPLPRPAVPAPVAAVLHHPLAGYPVLLLGIYLMHWFCWTTGLLYREGHHRFPWVLQYHVRTYQRHIPKVRDVAEAQHRVEASANSARARQRLSEIGQPQPPPPREQRPAQRPWWDDDWPT